MKIINRKAPFEYTIVDRIEAGIALAGSEVKSLRLGHGKLEGAFVKILNGEAYLVNAEITMYPYARPNGYDPKRTRKLLLHKKELISLQSKLESAKLTLIPLSWYTKGPQMKLEIGLARGKKQYEKREIKKKKDLQRELEVDFRGKIK
ncbi:MAG: SsrA-binding protein SmpB [Candidatus Gottesmanbacteria bacterium]